MMDILGGSAPIDSKTTFFGGDTIEKVVMCDAVTGKCTMMNVEDVPSWVDKVYPTDLLINQYNYNGSLSGGWINSVFGQDGVHQSTDGYNYIAKDDDVWVYTGVTSATSDNSIIGFVLINQRTAEAKCPLGRGNSLSSKSNRRI